MNVLRFSNYARIALWCMAGLWTGTVFGITQLQGMQAVGKFGFIGGFAGGAVGIIACRPWPWFLQGIVAGMFSGVVAGLLNASLLSAGQHTLEAFTLPVVGFTVGLTVYRFMGRHKRTFYFRSCRTSVSDRTKDSPGTPVNPPSPQNPA